MIAISFGIGVSRYKVMSRSAKLILVLTGFSLLSEIFANIWAIIYENNYPVYNVYGLIEFSVLAYYFVDTTDSLKAKVVPIVLIGLGLLIGIFNMLLLQSPFSFCSNFLLLEGFSILSLCLYSFYRMLLGDNSIKLIYNPDFWFKTIFFIYWSATYLTWPLYNLLDSRHIDLTIVNNGLLLLGVFVYLVIGMVFLFYKRMISHE